MASNLHIYWADLCVIWLGALEKANLFPREEILSHGSLCKECHVSATTEGKMDDF
jgi:hypothetical protein